MALFGWLRGLVGRKSVKFVDGPQPDGRPSVFAPPPELFKEVVPRLIPDTSPFIGPPVNLKPNDMAGIQAINYRVGGPVSSGEVTS